MEYPESFKNLIEAFARLPGVGYKSAERMAYSYLDLLPEYKEKFEHALSNVNKIKHCHTCFNLSDSEECEICKDKNRDAYTICVVSNPKDVFAIEKTNTFSGKYHVLNGVISLKKGK